MPAFAFFLTFAAGIMFGLLITQFSISHWVEMLSPRYGIWYFTPHVGSTELDPYHRAWLFNRGELPLADGEGISLHTHTDASGSKLHTTCSYRFEGSLPPARYWTLTVTDKEGRRLLNQANRYGFSSSELIYPQGKPFFIILSPHVHPGNWVPLAEQGEFSVVLRFYETPLSARATTLNAAQLPTLTRIGCPQ